MSFGPVPVPAFFLRCTPSDHQKEQQPYLRAIVVQKNDEIPFPSETSSICTNFSIIAAPNVAPPISIHFAGTDAVGAATIATVAITVTVAPEATANTVVATINASTHLSPSFQ